jgi:hypothetical protein
MKAQSRIPHHVAPAYAHTPLYPLLPKGLGTGQCENMSSYLARLAAQHHVSIQKLCGYLVQYDPQHRSIDPDKCATARIFDTTFPLIDALETVTGRQEVRFCSISPLRTVLHFRGRTSSESLRHCPECIKEDAYPQSWNRLIWDLPFVTACPIHLKRLVPSRCGRPTGDWIFPGHRVLLPAVCRSCGTVGFQCNADAQCSRDATDSEIWVAEETAKLITAVTGGTAIDRELALECFNRIVRNCWGSVAQAERDIGMSQGTLRHVMDGTRKIGIDVLISVCSWTNTEMASVLLGEERLSKGKVPSYRRCPKARRWYSRQAVAESVGTTTICEWPSRIARYSPDLAERVKAMRKEARLRQRWKRLLRVGRMLKATKRQLQTEGLSFNPYNIMERAGLMLFDGSPEHRLYLFIRNRP